MIWILFELHGFTVACYVATAVQMYQMLLYKWLSLVNVLASVCTYTSTASCVSHCVDNTQLAGPTVNHLSYQERITNALAVTFKFSSIHASIGHCAAYTLSSLHVWFAG